MVSGTETYWILTMHERVALDHTSELILSKLHAAPLSANCLVAYISFSASVSFIHFRNVTSRVTTPTNSVSAIKRTPDTFWQFGEEINLARAIARYVLF